jgi:oligopeptide/dipeptide ABC transporter ATP-binding protein
MSVLMEIRGLKTYFFLPEGIVKAVDGISYDIYDGETLGLVGESGCGKSATALSLMRLIPTPPGKILEGEVIFSGRDLLKLNYEQIRHIRGNEIAMIFQEPMIYLNPVLNIGRQLTEGMALHLKLDKAEATKRAIELLGMVGISDSKRLLSQYPHQYSGGMLQRVMIAMALSCNPKLILADEPSTALDVTIQAQILELMKDLTQQFGVALIIITHNMGVVARYCDRMNVMYAGRIVECGKARDVYAKPGHPYTIGLLKSVPRLDLRRKERLDPIEGQPPNLTNLPVGCSFRERCSFAIGRCSQEFPPLASLGDGHCSACWMADKVCGAAI